MTTEVNKINEALSGWIEKVTHTAEKADRDAAAAIERAQKAEAEATYLRGQNELLMAQKRDDAKAVSALQQRCDELQTAVRLYIENSLSIAKKLEFGEYRKEAPPPKLTPQIEDEIRSVISQTAKEQRREAPLPRVVSAGPIKP